MFVEEIGLSNLFNYARGSCDFFEKRGSKNKFVHYSLRVQTNTKNPKVAEYPSNYTLSLKSTFQIGSYCHVGKQTMF